MPKRKPPAVKQCAELVQDSASRNFHQCWRDGGHGIDGRYCKQHAKRHPVPRPQFEIDAENEQRRLDCLESRRQKFAIELEPGDPLDYPGEFRLLITHNGSHWRSVELLPEEADAVIAALQSWRSTHAR